MKDEVNQQPEPDMHESDNQMVSNFTLLQDAESRGNMSGRIAHKLEGEQVGLFS